MNHDETPYFTPVNHRKPALKKKPETDDIQTMNIRFDYSDAYLQNEDLTYQLEDHEDALHKEKYKASIDREERLKKVKQDADERLSLKNAIKNRDPNESSRRVCKSADFRRKGSQKQLQRSAEMNTPYLGEGDRLSTYENEHSVSDMSIIDKLSVDETDSSDKDALIVRNEDTKSISKPLTNLTTFLISLQKFKRKELNKPDDSTDRRESRDDHANRLTAYGERSKTRTKSVSTASPGKQYHVRPATVHETKSRPKVQLPDPLETDQKSAQYGIHVKTDFTRSRRKLEEISRLEQDAKFGHVNKYEERRKRLLASCKDTKNIDKRIQHFLKDIDEFKKSSSNENSLEKVLMRARSARLSRSNTFW